MKKIIVFIFLFVSINVSAQNDTAEDTTAKPAITAIGKPDGEKTEIKIGKEGGSIASSDGKVALIIPEGAISKKINFSIQPITNMIPNGNGKGYRLEPSGIQFNQPVQLVFHYDEDGAKDSMQLLMGIAMQDNTGQWYSLRKFTLDTVAKTIIGNINHFSDWSKFDAIKITPENGRVKVKKNIVLTITSMEPSPKDEGDGELVKLERKPKKTIWKVNGIQGGNASVGKLEFVNSFTIGNRYTAPAEVPAQNPVAVSVKLEGLNWFPNGVKGDKFNNLSLVSNILIYDNAYEVKIISSMNGMAGSELGRVTYKDTGSFVVAINGKDTKLIEKVNKNAVDKLDYKGKCIITLLKAGTGNVHIIGAQSIQLIPASAAGNAWIDIKFKRVPTIFSLLQAKCPPVGKGEWTTTTTAQANAMAAAMMPAFPQQLKFELKEGEQTQVIGEEGGEIYVKYIITQLKDD